jgi:hypothetical protein
MSVNWITSPITCLNCQRLLYTQLVKHEEMGNCYIHRQGLHGTAQRWSDVPDALQGVRLCHEARIVVLPAEGMVTEIALRAFVQQAEESNA